MATPMTPDQFLEMLKQRGISYVEHTVDGVSWKNHNRDMIKPFGPMNGLILHHTGDDAPDSADFNVLWHGRTGLPGPLCNWGMDDNGVVQLVGWGRANHAGGGDPNVFNAVINESYTDYPPAPHYHDGSAGAVDGNSHFYGQETMYSGSHVMTVAAYHSTVQVFAGVCAFHGWSAKSCIGHKEWSDWKSDPGSLDMKKFRADVQANIILPIGGRGSVATPVTVQTVSTNTQEKPMSTILYARRGTPDVVTAFNWIQDTGKGYVTSDLSDVRTQVFNGARVIAVGGPACTDLAGLKVTFINGTDASDTDRLLNAVKP